MRVTLIRELTSDDSDTWVGKAYLYQLAEPFTYTSNQYGEEQTRTTQFVALEIASSGMGNEGNIWPCDETGRPDYTWRYDGALNVSTPTEMLAYMGWTT